MCPVCEILELLSMLVDDLANDDLRRKLRMLLDCEGESISPAIHLSTELANLCRKHRKASNFGKFVQLLADEDIGKIIGGTTAPPIRH